jgi:hypothetical protein
MKATSYSVTSVDFQPTTRRYIPENKTLPNHRCENLKSYIEKYSYVWILYDPAFSSCYYGKDTVHFGIF